MCESYDSRQQFDTKQSPPANREELEMIAQSRADKKKRTYYVFETPKGLCVGDRQFLGIEGVRPVSEHCPRKKQKAAPPAQTALELRALVDSMGDALVLSWAVAAAQLFAGENSYTEKERPIFNTAGFQDVGTRWLSEYHSADAEKMTPKDAETLLGSNPRIVRLYGGSHWYILQDGHRRYYGIDFGANGTTVGPVVVDAQGEAAPLPPGFEEAIIRGVAAHLNESQRLRVEQEVRHAESMRLFNGSNHEMPCPACGERVVWRTREPREYGEILNVAAKDAPAVEQWIANPTEAEANTCETLPPIPAEWIAYAQKLADMSGDPHYITFDGKAFDVTDDDKHRFAIKHLFPKSWDGWQRYHARKAAAAEQSIPDALSGDFIVPVAVQVVIPSETTKAGGCPTFTTINAEINMTVAEVRRRAGLLLEGAGKGAQS
jgi:hypothetical protein